MTSSDMELFRIKGNRHFGLKQFEQAIDWYSKALDEQRSALVYSNRAQAYLELDRNADAFLDAQKALQLAPDNSKALYRCGLALFRLGRLEFAKEMLEKCAAQKEDKHVEMKLEEIKQMLEQRNASKCANANLNQNKANSAGAIVSTDIWRQLFTFIGPAERPNVGQLNRTIWSTFWDHHFQRSKKRLTRRLIYQRDPRNGEEQFLVKETFGTRLHVVPFAETSPPPNIVGLDLCIEDRPGKKLLKFLTQNKNFLTHSTLKFECLTNFITTVHDKFRRQFLQLFANDCFVAFWGQSTNLFNFEKPGYRIPSMQEICQNAEQYFYKFEEECKPINRIAIYGPIGNELNAIRLDFLIGHLANYGFERDRSQLRVLTLDDDWLPDNEMHEFRRRLVYGVHPKAIEGVKTDPERMLIHVLYGFFATDANDDGGGRSKYALSMQRMPRHKEGFKVKQGHPYILHKINKLGDVFDLRLHIRNGKECLLLRRCPVEDLEKEYMHPDILFANPKGEEFASRIMVAGIDNELHPTHCKLRTHLPDDPHATNRKSEMQAYFDLNTKNPELGLAFKELPRFFYFDFVQREWIKRERPFNSVQVFL